MSNLLEEEEIKKLIKQAITANELKTKRIVERSVSNRLEWYEHRFRELKDRLYSMIERISVASEVMNGVKKNYPDKVEVVLSRIIISFDMSDEFWLNNARKTVGWWVRFYLDDNNFPKF